MKTGSVHAIVAMLAFANWVLAQAPLPSNSSDANPSAPTIRPVALAPSAPMEVKAGLPAMTPGTLTMAEPVSGVLPAGGCFDAWPPRQYHVWANADFIMWRINNGSVPALTAQPPVGVLTVQPVDFLDLVNNDGSVTTTVQPQGTIGYFPVTIQQVPTLPNSNSVNLGEHTGARFNLGVWFTPDQLIGLEGSAFFLEPKSQTLANAVTNANNQIVFTTPFNDREFTVTPALAAPGGTPSPPTRTQTATIPIIFVRQLDSSAAASLSNQLYGAELNARTSCCSFGPVLVGGLLGFRYTRFNEDLDVRGLFDLTTPLTVAPVLNPATGGLRPDNLPASIVLQTRDFVACKNSFYGGNIGADFDGQFGKFFINLRTKVAMGGLHQRVEVTSFTTTTTSGTAFVPPGSVTTPGGLLFNQLNNGVYERDRISFIPELNLKVGCQLLSCLRGYVGYDIMYISNVVRPGEVSAPYAVAGSLQSTSAPSGVGTTGAGITNLNVNQPSFQFRDGNLWTQGFNFGIEVTY